MKRSVSVASILFAVGTLGLGLGGGQSARADEGSHVAKGITEDYAHVPMPPGFKVVATELEGPVFADAHGMTLYTWPYHPMGGGIVGDGKDKSVCDDKNYTKTVGIQIPYPAGLDLPDADKRGNCVTEWPPVHASADAKPVGKWTIIARADGTKQWAYDHHPLYTSALDHVPGDTIGATALSIRVGNVTRGGDAPGTRQPAGPPAAVPPGFKVQTTPRGRMLVTDKGYSTYTSDSDGPNKSNCFDSCTRMWVPVLAPESAQPQGEWSIVQRAPAVRQWAFRKKPLYTFTEDSDTSLVDGADVPGWHVAYTQVVPAAPKGFTIQTSLVGDVLADSQGKTIYFYTCVEDAPDAAHCDTMEGTQAYRLALCGNGDAARCQKRWPYVRATADAKSDSHLWSVVWVDPTTGHRAQASQPGAVSVWAYRDRPVYTYAGDKEPGDIEGNGIGEQGGWWNGFRMMWIRDQFNDRGI